MKFLMQIFQGEALEAWSRLSEEEQQGIAADYAALNETPGVTPGEWLAQPDAATTVKVRDGAAVTLGEASVLTFNGDRATGRIWPVGFKPPRLKALTVNAARGADLAPLRSKVGDQTLLLSLQLHPLRLSSSLVMNIFESCVCLHKL